MDVLEGKKVTLQIACCNTLLSKYRGLMFKKALKRNHALLIPSESACIHTFFMRFPIDVFWLDENLRVVDLKRNIKPWRPLVCPKKKSSFILEIPSVYKYNINIGDKFYRS